MEYDIKEQCYSIIHLSPALLDVFSKLSWKKQPERLRQIQFNTLEVLLMALWQMVNSLMYLTKSRTSLPPLFTRIYMYICLAEQIFGINRLFCLKPLSNVNQS